MDGYGKGVLKISYRNGSITTVTVTKSSGVPLLDKVAMEHVRRTFRLRPNTKGEAKMPFSNMVTVSKTAGHDFISRPSLPVPKGTTGHSALAQITYKNRKITDVEMINSSGNSAFDEAIVHHVMGYFKVKPQSSGRAALPIQIQTR